MSDLTKKQEMFCRYIVVGMNQSDAYRAAYDVKHSKPETVTREASRLRKNLKVVLRIEDLQAGLRAEQVTNIGREMLTTIEMRDEARAAKNYTAAASTQRLVLQGLGALQQHVHLHRESTMSDEDLISKLAGDDPERIKAARLLLGEPEGFPEPPKDSPHPSETRH